MGDDGNGMREGGDKGEEEGQERDWEVEVHVGQHQGCLVEKRMQQCGI